MKSCFVKDNQGCLTCFGTYGMNILLRCAFFSTGWQLHNLQKDMNLLLSNDYKILARVLHRTTADYSAKKHDLRKFQTFIASQRRYDLTIWSSISSHFVHYTLVSFYCLYFYPFPSKIKIRRYLKELVQWMF